MAVSAPVASDRADVDLYFDTDGSDVIDVGGVCVRFQFKAMMNGGYMIKGRLKDSNFNILKKFLIEAKYFGLARSSIFRCQFKIKWRQSDNATQLQTAYVIIMYACGGIADSADIEFMAIDPPSWYLNAGTASGKAYRGNVGQVIRNVVSDYAPDITLDVSDTVDSSQNTFWMMGMDPKTFISSLVDWSSSLTRNKTQWIIAMDDTEMQIKAQDEIESRNVAFYVGPHAGSSPPTIRDWEVLADNALSIVNANLVTNGASAVTGQYLDKSSAESAVTVSDANTSAKYKARVSANKSFTKAPNGSGPSSGWTTIQAIPEVYSAGEIGRSYAEYIDGRPRGLWLNMLNMVMRCRFRVIGHGVFSSGKGLGVDTVTVQWLDVDGQPFFLSGNWIVYGFEHAYSPGDWYTDVYCARIDHDADARPVPIIE